MPKISERAKTIKILTKLNNIQHLVSKKCIEKWRQVSSYDSDDGNDMIEFLKDYTEMFNPTDTVLKEIRSRRYFNSRIQGIPKENTKTEILGFLESLDRDAFIEEMRMSRESFKNLIELIKDHPVYQSSPKRPQTDIRIQVAVSLDKLGCKGNGVSLNKIARKYGIAKGSVPVFMKRFFTAVLSLEQQFVYWPNPSEKKVIINENARRFGFPDLLGFIDGCHMRLEIMLCSRKNKTIFKSQNNE